jgi:linoleoyl-CoA desaturase
MKTLYFAPEKSDFFKELKSKVDAHFEQKNSSVFGNRKMKIKLAIMFTIYLLAYASVFIYGENTTMLYFLYAFLGGWSVLLGLNIGHDAAHGAIFKRPKANKRLLFIFEILGTNSYNWVNRHLGAHHVYPNVMNYDSDIQQTSVVKIFPKDTHRKYHVFQFIYMPLIYMLYILRWVVYRDFKDAKSKRIGVYDNSNYPVKEILKMVLFKVLYLTQMIVIPALLMDLTFMTTIWAFLLLTVFGSLVITLVLLSTHVGEDANFPEPNAQNALPHSWSYHQVITAADFGTESHTINLLFGGFNHHVIHHLFPHICHIHYPDLTPLLIETAEKYGLEYRSKKYLFAAVLSHFKLLKRNAQYSYQTDQK